MDDSPKATDFLGQRVQVVIDRAMGTRHPRHHFVYPVNYGYVPGTVATDGGGIDAYVLGIFEPVEAFEGVCVAVIHRLDDNDDKLVVVPEGRTYSDEQIRSLTEFQEQWFTSVIVRG